MILKKNLLSIFDGLNIATKCFPTNKGSVVMILLSFAIVPYTFSKFIFNKK